MKFNTITKIMCVVGIIAAPLSQAATVNGSVAFSTVPDVSIVPLQALQFGGEMTLTLNDTCTMIVSSVGGPSEADANISNSGAGAGGTFQTRTGTCDNAVTGLAGIYEVSGGSGVPVKITANSLTGTNFNFVPAGVAGNYGTPDSNTLDNIVADTEMTVNLASVADVTGAVSGGAPQEKKTKIFMGGTLTATTPLDAGTTYTETFTIDVTY